MKKPSILLLYYDDGSIETQFNRQVTDDVYDGLSNRNYQVKTFQVNEDNWKKALKTPGDIAFNFVEDKLYDLYNKIESGLQDTNRVCFRSVSRECFDIVSDKAASKIKLSQYNIPTPGYVIIDSDDYEVELNYPLIVKPALCHSSTGISQKSVVIDEQAMRRRVKYVRKNFGKVIVEEFIQGREISVTVLGDRTHAFSMPFLEIIFYGPCNKWKIHSYETKWSGWAGKDSCEVGKEYMCPAPMSKALEKHINRIAIKAYKVLGFKDQARIDLKLADNGEVYLFDANSGPCISTLNYIDAQALGWSYEDYLEVLVGVCCRRVYGDMPPRAKFLLSALGE